ncbi:MAG: hypothetical protein AB1745_20090, partial [Pseudomonadota bacterium]
KPMNRTSKRIICLSVQTLDQPSTSPLAPQTGANLTSRIHRLYAITSMPDSRRSPNGILADSGTLCGGFIKRPLWPN